jgi:hypothetical protein
MMERRRSPIEARISLTRHPGYRALAGSQPA